MPRALILALALTCVESTTVAQERPNIVFILADDLGIGDVKCYGGDRCLIDTPNIDALASGGVRFTDAHVNASVCMPTRTAIMTGRYPWRFPRFMQGGPWGYVGCRYSPDTYTLADMLASAGYRTGYVGKWHLGTKMATTDGKRQDNGNVDFMKPLEIGPVQQGFDFSFILPGSLDMYPYAYVRNNIWQGEVTAQKGWSAFNRVGAAEKDFKDHEVLETFFGEAEAFIEESSSAAAKDPFFLYLALTAPHTPTSPGKKFQGKSQLGVYGDFVMEVDHAVERVMSALRKAGIEKNTLVLFSSDHGPAPYAGNILKATPGQIHLMEEQGHYPAGPYRGYKFAVYEGALRVPLIAHWPGQIPPGTKCDGLVGLCDLMATLGQVAGAKIPNDAGVDSVSFADLLKTPGKVGGRSDLIMQSVGPFVVRQGKWKLCLCPGSGAAGVYGNVPASADAWKAALKRHQGSLTWEDLTQAPFLQLFDLSADSHEDTNLAAQHPERVKAMVALLRAQMDSGRSTPGPALPVGRRHNIHQRLPEFVRAKLPR